MKDFDRYLSVSGRARVPHLLRQKVDEIMGMMGVDKEKFLKVFGGLPNPISFPFTSMTVTLRDGTVVTLDEDATETALQYSPCEGTLELRTELRKQVAHFHNPPGMQKSLEEGGTNIIVSSGSSDAIEKIFNLLCDRDEYVLIEEYSYPGTIALLQTMGLKPLMMEMDGLGVKPDSLRALLSRWKPSDARRRDSDIPRMMYITPTGQNPTGTTLPLSRRKEIYKIAQEYDIIIFEDDPHYFLTDEIIPSFLSLDVDDRVLRAETFSKTICPGLRCGYMAGPAPLISKIVYHAQVSTNGPSTLSQVLITQLYQRWGIQGYMDHMERIKKFYLDKRAVMIASCNKYLKDRYEWVVPPAVMGFIWLKSKDLEDTNHLAYVRGAKWKVFFPSGSAFSPVLGVKSPYLRTTFFCCTSAEIDLACKTLAEMTEEEIAESE